MKKIWKYRKNILLIAIAATMFIVSEVLRLTVYQTIAMTFIFVILYSIAYILYLTGWHYVKRRLMRILGFAFPFIAFIVVRVMLHHFYPNEHPSYTDVFAVSGDYLSFVGAFFLGYFIYFKDEEKRNNEGRLKIRALRECIERIDKRLFCISQAANAVEESKKGNIDCTSDYGISTFEYDKDWRLSYYIYESIAGEDELLQNSIEKFFEMVDDANYKLKNKDIIGLCKKYNDYVKESINYSFLGCGILDVEMALLSAEKEISLQYSPLNIQQKKTQKKIKRWKKKLYFCIENYIYNILIKEKNSAEGNGTDIHRQVVDWLLENSDDIKEYLKESPREANIVSLLVLSCSLDFNKKSTKVNYGWNTYSLK